MRYEIDSMSQINLMRIEIAWVQSVFTRVGILIATLKVYSNEVQTILDLSLRV